MIEAVIGVARCPLAASHRDPDQRNRSRGVHRPSSRRPIESRRRRLRCAVGAASAWNSRSGGRNEKADGLRKRLRDENPATGRRPRLDDCLILRSTVTTPRDCHVVSRPHLPRHIRLPRNESCEAADHVHRRRGRALASSGSGSRATGAVVLGHPPAWRVRSAVSRPTGSAPLRRQMGSEATFRGCCRGHLATHRRESRHTSPDPTSSSR